VKPKPSSVFYLNWKYHVMRSCTPEPVVEPEFDREVARLGLVREQFAKSSELRSWVRRNYERRYVPEDVLVLFGLRSRC
jgi:hypothetical protein